LLLGLLVALAVALGTGCRLPRPAAHPMPAGFGEVDGLLEGFRERRAFPGGVLAVGTAETVLHLHPFGRLTYAPDAPPVTAGTLYDLASLTKVVATTTLAMILFDEGKIDLDRPVQAYIPEFAGPGKAAVTVRHLLSHSSGLPPEAPLYREFTGHAAILGQIEAMELAYPPGTQSRYSDFGMIHLGEVL
jgi:CubicO group peptidase (beta-lactamase class C family)